MNEELPTLQVMPLTVRRRVRDRRLRREVGRRKIERPSTFWDSGTCPAAENSVPGKPVEPRRKCRAKLRGSAVGFMFQQSTVAGTPPWTSDHSAAVRPGPQFRRRREVAMEMLDLLRIAGGAQIMPACPAANSNGWPLPGVIRRRALLGDEPTGALDVDTGQAAMGQLDTVATGSGAALVTVTHDVNVAALARACDRLESGVCPRPRCRREFQHDRPGIGPGGGMAGAAERQNPDPPCRRGRGPLSRCPDLRGGGGQPGPGRL